LDRDIDAGVLEVTAELMADIAAVIRFWETSQHVTFCQSYPMDWNPTILYAEWDAEFPYQGPGSSYNCPYRDRRRKKPELFNGFTNSNNTIEPLQGLLRDLEQKHHVIIDHVYANRAEGHISALWHLPGAEVRNYGRAPVAAAAVPVQIHEKGVV
jgi:hypothetical protein